MNSLNLYKKLEADLKHIGEVLCPAYGTMLGAVRDGKQIAWDKGLLDVMVILGKPNEMERLNLILMYLYEKGYIVKVCKYRAFVSHPSMGKARLDFQWAWYDNGEFGISFGWKYDRAKYKEGKYVDVKFEGVVMKVPDNAKEILTMIYGDWQNPDPDFKHTSIVNDINYWI